jgi:RNA polymerase sigma-70 factor (ECF subfamily)
MVFQAAFRVLGSAADADDVAQDVFAEILTRRCHEHVENWGAYLRRLAVFRALDRRRTRRQMSPIQYELPAQDLSPLDEAVRRELANRLRDIIAVLPEREGAVFALSHFERLANPQIASVLGISVGAVAAALHKVRQKLEAVVAEAL